MELLKAIGLVPDKAKEKREHEEDGNNKNNHESGEWEVLPNEKQAHTGSSGSVPTQRSATLGSPTVLVDSGSTPLVDVDLSSDDSQVKRRRSTSTADVLNKLEDVVFFWNASKTSRSDETDDPYANTAADSFASAAHGGWLTKQGAIHKTWRKRYFVLNEHLLFYFEGSSARRPKGVIDLTGCEVMRDMTRGKKHCFQVSHKKNMQQRIFLLHAKDDDDMKQWMRLINEAIDRTRPVNPDGESPSASPLSSKTNRPPRVNSEEADQEQESGKGKEVTAEGGDESLI